MTATGKITTSRLHEGSRIMVRHDRPSKSSTVYPSANKVKDAFAVTVSKVTPVRNTTISRRVMYDIEVIDDAGKTYTIHYAVPSQTFWLAPIPERPTPGRGYVALFHSSSTKETMALHREGCADIERDRERHGSNLQAFEAKNLTEALDVVVDDELQEMGYTHNDVRVYPCVTSTEPKEGTSMTTATATRKSTSKPAPTSARPKKETTAKATAAKPEKVSAKSTKTVRARIDAPAGFKSWDDPKLAARVLREKKAGSTIKAITAGLKLPADERHWHKVSLVYRAAADAKGSRTTKRSK